MSEIAQMLARLGKVAYWIGAVLAVVITVSAALPAYIAARDLITLPPVQEIAARLNMKLAEKVEMLARQKAAEKWTPPLTDPIVACAPPSEPVKVEGKIVRCKLQMTGEAARAKAALLQQQADALQEKLDRAKRTDDKIAMAAMLPMVGLFAWGAGWTIRYVLAGPEQRR